MEPAFRVGDRVDVYDDDIYLATGTVCMCLSHRLDYEVELDNGWLLESVSEADLLPEEA